MLDPQPDFRPVHGVAEPLRPGLRRIVAPNASAMTFRGTNTYLLGESEVAVIDPGPDDPAHLAAILAAVGPTAAVSAILVTHAHRDHSALAPGLARATDAPVYAFGDAQAGRSALMQALAQDDTLEGGEGVDIGFAPHHQLLDGATLQGREWTLTALHTPGHMANHLSFAWNDVLFTGDLVMGWASSLVSPPDGDVAAFMASLRRLQSGGWTQFLPGHGGPVDAPGARLSELIAHRLGREAAIIDALMRAPATPDALARDIYGDIDPSILPAARRNVLAHLIDLMGKNRVSVDGRPSVTGLFTLTNSL